MLLCLYMTIKSPIKQKTFGAELKTFEEARNAVIKLKTLQPLLSPADEETLSILMDKHLMDHLAQSLDEAVRGKLEPLNKILK
ncbi:MAG: hypothetical protein G01um101429_504 [Parcubacteria group bacterium Gr01-1014_29]|nr:MAG: hypothetical protein G01um101429_504 [Parcubacteria group bacterium Gr01-1014_29]